MPGTHARMLRSTATAAVVFFLAAGAHLAGGAALPGLHILAALAVSTLLAVTVLARKKLSLAAVLGILGLGQLVLHEAFTTLTTTAAACVPTSRGHFGPQQVHCQPVGLMEHAHAFSLFDSPMMLAAHAAAVVVTALMLHYGETAIELALQWFRPLAALPRILPTIPVADLPPVPEVPTRRYSAPLLAVSPLRGPPLLSSH
ncbi:hypothetical protein GC088_01845 [Arthrobacter sp. JZ12]|uniref:hypothetical protein n=1 Tax=Arthrobacter sp. JZ12 TaxID=2654190 RepID=UPI002B49857A|nr:hypothetical protein [Arthrobacter sp. JZ12]WRH23979.1 hypothetical protein GC088_01845 [Arthrobacter sp. JZ12]